MRCAFAPPPGRASSLHVPRTRSVSQINSARLWRAAASHPARSPENGIPTPADGASPDSAKQIAPADVKTGKRVPSSAARSRVVPLTPVSATTGSAVLAGSFCTVYPTAPALMRVLIVHCGGTFGDGRVGRRSTAAASCARAQGGRYSAALDPAVYWQTFCSMCQRSAPWPISMSSSR